MPKMCSVVMKTFHIIFLICLNNMIYNLKKELHDISESHYTKLTKLETNHLDIVLSFCFSAGIPITIMLQAGIKSCGRNKKLFVTDGSWRDGAANCSSGHQP